MIAQQVQFVWPGTAIEIAVIVVLLLVLRWLLLMLIRRGVKLATQKPHTHTEDLSARAAETLHRAQSQASVRQSARIATLGSVLRSITDVTLVVIGVFSVLNSLNINIGPAIASAGIGGVALGFGAQSLVKDFISGIFMIFEDQYGVGDFVTIGDLNGTVRAVGFRVTELQDPSGKVWYVRNGEISKLGNLSQGWSSDVLSFLVALDEQPSRVIGVLQQVLAQVDADPVWHAKLLEAPSVLGLSAFTADSATYQVAIKTPANGQWDVEREIRARVAAAFQKDGIRGPRQIVATAAPITLPPEEDAEPSGE